MITMKVTGDLEKVVGQWALIASDQMPFAVASALTKTAKEAKIEVEAKLPQMFDRPTPYTLHGFRLWPATKTKLQAEVDFRDSFGKGTHARDYLAPEVFGGERKLKAFEKSLQRVGLLPAGMAAMPGSAAKIDQYGNMARGQIVQLLSYFRAFGEQGYRSNITDKRKQALARGNAKKGTQGVVYFVGRPAGGRLPNGIWQRTSDSAGHSNIKPLVIFVKRPNYKVRFDLPTIAAKVINDRFEPNLRAAWKQAMATRRPIQRPLF